MSNVKECMDCLERFIVEEDKIVTYKWLSIKLKIHVNTSKKLLYSYANTHDKDKLGICYLLAGEKPDGSCQVVVCRKKDVPKTKESFKVVTSQHVYSIQKRDTDANLNVILNSPVKRIEECIEDFKRLTSIEYSESVVRDNTDMQKLKMKALLASKEAVPSISKPAVSEDKKQIKTEKENLPSNITNKEPKKESVNGIKKGGGLAAMFAAQKEVKNEVKKPMPQQNKPKGGLNMFFNSEKKTNSDKTNKVKIESPKKQDMSPKKEKAPEPDSTQMDVDTASEEEKESTKVDDSKKNTKNKSKTSQSKRKRKNKTDEKQKKKRKRIMTMSDSESDDEDNKEEEYDRVDDSPLREPTPPPPLSDDETPVVGKKARKKKMVESTFMDEEGYLVTKKEYTLVSDSEDEGENDNVKNSTEESQKPGIENAQADDKKKETNESQKSASKKESKPLPPKSKISPKSNKVSPQKNKQASITSFFTKK